MLTTMEIRPKVYRIIPLLQDSRTEGKMGKELQYVQVICNKIKEEIVCGVQKLV
jgi:hypothetical protein